MFETFETGCRMPRPIPPPGYDEIHRSELARMFGRVVGTRMLVAPVVAVGIVTLAWWDPAPWRRWALVTGAMLVTTVSFIELRRFRARGMGPRSAELNLTLAVFGQLLGTVATGGIESPALPLMAVLALMLGLILIERPALLVGLIGMQIASLWCLAFLAVHGRVASLNPVIFGGGARAGHGDVLVWTAATVMTLVVVLAQGLGRALRRVFDAMLWRALEANEELRRGWAERSQELMALSAEIAHELKNPMASVKGLAALLSQSLDGDKGRERLGVLRREVDRMHGILDEFLNFSRPLVPLSLEPEDLAALCEEVAALHEGLARERGVTLRLSAAAAAPVRCDARKVKQILINLIQNALDASPAGEEIVLECGAEGARSRVRVLDRGPGLDPAIEPRLFEPGATTKARGSGLGLTIARALARQHGGELTLGAREGGGCAAVLTLPVVPAVEGAAMAQG